MTEPGDFQYFGVFCKKVRQLTEKMTDAREDFKRLTEIMEKFPDDPAREENAQLLEKCQIDIERLSSLGSKLSAILSSLIDSNSCEINDIDSRYVIFFEAPPLWPTCKRGSSTSCGECTMRVFIKESELLRHLEEKRTQCRIKVEK